MMAMDRENRSFSFAEWDAEIARLRRKLAKAKRKADKLRRQRDAARAREWPSRGDQCTFMAAGADRHAAHVSELISDPAFRARLLRPRRPATAPSASGPVSDSPKPEIAAHGPLRGAEGYPDFANGEQP